jgi:uncharacterized membrane protein YdbT with pleckstrin-like domain
MADTYLNQLLGDDEQILYVTRRHWLVLAGEILSESVLTLALAVLISLVLALWPPAAPWVALGYLLLLLPIISLGRDVAVWANHKFVVTNRRILHVAGVLDKDITDSSLEKVNDVKLEQSLWGRLFNFGNVEILTASELGVNKFGQIADPIKFKTAMLNAKHRLEQNEDFPQARASGRAKAAAPSLADRMNEQLAPAASSVPASVPADIPGLLSQLDQLRQAGVLTEAEFQNKKAQLLARL